MTIKKNLLVMLAMAFLFSVPVISLQAQSASEKVKGEIAEALKQFNTAAQNASTDQLMLLFDDTENIMFIGSDSAEIWKGHEQIRRHLNSIFPKERVFLDMSRTDIDCNGETAWIFADGTISITGEKGEKMTAPYRFTGILVKKNHLWKWRLFDGSSPAGK